MTLEISFCANASSAALSQTISPMKCEQTITQLVHQTGQIISLGKTAFNQNKLACSCRLSFESLKWQSFKKAFSHTPLNCGLHHLCSHLLFEISDLCCIAIGNLQCTQIRSNFATLAIFECLFLFAKIVNPYLNNSYAIGQIFIIVIGQILSK